MIEAIYLAAASRLHGHDSFLPKPVKAAFYALPYGVYSGLRFGPFAAIAALLCAALIKNLGHADGFRNYVRDNTLSKITAPIAEKFGIERNSQTYDALFWAIKGALIPAATLNPFLIAASAIGYPLAYWLGFNVLNRKLGLPNTAWGEILGGFIAGLGFLG